MLHDPTEYDIFIMREYTIILTRVSRFFLRGCLYKDPLYIFIMHLRESNKIDYSLNSCLPVSFTILYFIILLFYDLGGIFITTRYQHVALA